MVCVLDATQEVSPTGSAARGAGTFVVDTLNNTMTYSISFAGLSSSETMAHIHGPAWAGTNAGILEPLSTGSPKNGVWNYPESAEADILAGSTYVNIHTVSHGGGEIRGQIVTHVSILDGTQAGIPASGGRGTGLYVMDKDANTLTYYITFENLLAAESVSHIHGYGNYDDSAGVVHPLANGSPKSGVWSYPEGQEAQIEAGLTYVNVHSTLHGGGEIRGQIVPLIVPIDSSQETPDTGSPGLGIASIALDTDADQLGYHILYQNLTSSENAAHIHGYSARGEDSAPVHALAVGNPKVGVWDYPGANEQDILSGLTYINIHTTMHSPGEIRGQIEPEVECELPTGIERSEWPLYR